jgi:opacity protein-like surface antigen
VLSFLLLGAAPLAAQSGVTVGGLAGATFFTFHGSDADLFNPQLDDVSKGTRVGFAAGAFAEFALGAHVAVEPQLLYVQKGAGYDATSNGTSATATFRLDYIEMPVLAKVVFGRPEATVRPSLFAGPAVGFKVHCALKAAVPIAGEQNIDCSDEVTGTGFSLVFGAGLAYERFTLQGRYDLGLTEVAADGFDISNGGFLLTMGYGVRLN